MSEKYNGKGQHQYQIFEWQPFKRKDCAQCRPKDNKIPVKFWSGLIVLILLVDPKTTVSKYLSIFVLVVATGGAAAAGADIFLRGGAEYDLDTWIFFSLFLFFFSFSLRGGTEYDLDT